MTSEFASDIAASASYNGLTGNMFRKQLINGELKLVRYYMDNRDIENGIESSPKLIETIKSIGKGARAVSDVFVVVQAEIYEATKGGGKFDFKSSANAEAQLDRETTIVLSPKTVLAYMLQKIDWEEKQKKNWSKIEKLIEDPKGL